MNNLNKYKSLIFDCDGVILNSNKIKIEAFRKVLQKFNPLAVEELINYLKNNFGTSRYILLDKFLNTKNYIITSMGGFMEVLKKR